MKRHALLLLVATALVFTSFAQKSVERIEIQGGSRAWENFFKEIYRYENFQPGIVQYKNGKQYKGTLNYNKVLGTIQFIDENGDTLAMNNEQDVSAVHIGEDEFYYILPDCLEKITDVGKLKLVKNERIRIADKQKVGGLGIPNSTGTIESIDRIDTRIDYNQIDINEKLLLNKTTRFFIETEKKELIPASKKNILSLFPKQEDAIKAYIKSHQIDFTREDHLADLTGYLAQL
jgi:hypothetical protein